MEHIKFSHILPLCPVNEKENKRKLIPQVHSALEPDVRKLKIFHELG